MIKTQHSHELFATMATLKMNCRDLAVSANAKDITMIERTKVCRMFSKVHFSTSMMNLRLTKLSKWLIVLSHQKNNIKTSGVKQINLKFYLICKQCLGHKPPALIRSVSPLVMCCYGWAVLQNSLCLFSCFRLAAETLGGRREFTTPTHQMKEEMVEGERKNEKEMKRKDECSGAQR